ncbi:MAG TPA: Mur ligase family protein [Gemmatimonadales bacterium]|nr:Mur ligase family protein [Gemmatimonadales bacterium]
MIEQHEMPLPEESRGSRVEGPVPVEAATDEDQSPPPDTRLLYSGTIRLIDSRRVPGPNLLWDRPGAVIDLVIPDEYADAFIARWQHEAAALLAAVGWSGEGTATRRFPGGVSLALSAPIDCLFTATEVNEWAFDAARSAIVGSDPPDLTEAVRLLRIEIEAEQKPRLVALEKSARSHHVTFLMDPQLISVGSGTGSQVWKVDELPPAEAVDWSRVHDVPAVLVTGSNGKTTTARLLTRVLTSAGRVTGMCCTDSVIIGGETIARGDWAGPGGARMVLRDRRVEVAVLETARGGILRRGLAVRQAAAAIVTNIAEDHFGEYGITDLTALAEAKLVVAKAIGPDGILVLNADDPVLSRSAGSIKVPICWFSTERDQAVLARHRATGGAAVWLDGDALVASGPGQPARFITRLDEVPITLGGAARHNVSNAIGVVALALGLGVEPRAIASGLARFQGSPAENPGRLNVFQLNGVTAVADFAHNPHGMDALVRMAQALPATRRLLVLGQAGDRDNAAIADLTRSAWAFRPDRIILKEMEYYRRGRPVGEVTGLMREEFIRLGASPASISGAASEFEALLEALRWARRGDLLLLPLHAERERGLALLERLRKDGWQPGDEVRE